MVGLTISGLMSSQKAQQQLAKELDAVNAKLSTTSGLAGEESTTQNTQTQVGESTTKQTTTDSSEISAETVKNIKFKALALSSQLEGYFTVNQYYPNVIEATTFEDATDLISLPSGAKYVYNVAPSGCSTAAKNCTKFTLGVVDGSGKALIAEIKSIN